MYLSVNGTYVSQVTQSMLRTYEVKQVFSEREKIGFNDSAEVTECIQQIEIPNFLHMCAPCFELLSNNSTIYIYI